MGARVIGLVVMLAFCLAETGAEAEVEAGAVAEAEGGGVSDGPRAGGRAEKAAEASG